MIREKWLSFQCKHPFWFNKKVDEKSIGFIPFFHLFRRMEGETTIQKWNKRKKRLWIYIYIYTCRIVVFREFLFLSECEATDGSSDCDDGIPYYSFHLFMCLGLMSVVRTAYTQATCPYRGTQNPSHRTTSSRHPFRFQNTQSSSPIFFGICERYI